MHAPPTCCAAVFNCPLCRLRSVAKHVPNRYRKRSKKRGETCRHDASAPLIALLLGVWSLCTSVAVAWWACSLLMSLLMSSRINSKQLLQSAERNVGKRQYASDVALYLRMSVVGQLTNDSNTCHRPWALFSYVNSTCGWRTRRIDKDTRERLHLMSQCANLLPNQAWWICKPSRCLLVEIIFPVWCTLWSTYPPRHRADQILCRKKSLHAHIFVRNWDWQNKDARTAVYTA